MTPTALCEYSSFYGRWQTFVFYDPDWKMRGFSLWVLYDHESSPEGLTDFQVEREYKNVLPRRATVDQVVACAEDALYLVIMGQLVSDPKGIFCDFENGD